MRFSQLNRATITAAIVVVVSTIVLLFVWSEALPDDPWNGAPRCTDAIADAGGICHGEPLPPCPTEDSDDCYWDGGANGLGRSFVVESGVVTYTD